MSRATDMSVSRVVAGWNTKPELSTRYITLMDYKGKEKLTKQKPTVKLVVCCSMLTPISFGKKPLLCKVFLYIASIML